MKVIAKFSLEESKCIPELLPCTLQHLAGQCHKSVDTTVKKSQNPWELRAICQSQNI